jgi:DNA-binding phage protein
MITTENTIMLADSALSQAKHRFSLACLACLRGALDAPAMVQAALQEVDRARAMLRRAADAELSRGAPK